MRFVCLFSVLLASSAIAADAIVFRGELACSKCGSFGNYLVQITDYSRNPVASAYVSTTGEFTFNNLSEGNYFLYVKGLHGQDIYMQPVNVSRGGLQTVVRLPESRVKSAEVPTGVVSVHRLQHEVPKEARKHFRAAIEKAKESDNVGAVKELKKALEIDPEYSEAWNNLGARYIYMGDLDAALDAFNSAIELDPTSAAVNSNVAMTLMLKGDAVNAELAARRAIDSDPSMLRARYILGLSLHAQRKFTPEAMEQLRRVQDLYPNARLALAEMAVASGKQQEAIKQLEAYLDGPDQNKQNRAAAEKLLVALH